MRGNRRSNRKRLLIFNGNFKKYTDSEHQLTVQEIVDLLEE